MLDTVAQTENLDRFRPAVQGNRIQRHRIDVIEQISPRTFFFHCVDDFEQCFQCAQTAENPAGVEGIADNLVDSVFQRNFIFQTLMFQLADAENGNDIVGAPDSLMQVY